MKTIRTGSAATSNSTVSPSKECALTVDGPGGEQEVETDENGQWRVGVPERGETYIVTLDEDTLPEGIVVVDPEDDTPNVKEVDGRRRAVA